VVDDRLERLFRAHSSQLFVCALAVTGCAQRAEDAVQDAFCRLFRLRREPRDLKAYVFRAVRNAAVDQVRRHRLDGFDTTEHLFDLSTDPERAAAENEFRQSVTTALKSLTDDQRETVISHLYAGLSFREIAEAREISINTVSSWYRRGIERLRKLLEQHDDSV